MLTYSFSSIGQEICDNGIDDDFDGLIDLNDDDCICYQYLNTSIIYDFEEFSCCPSSGTQMYCLDEWHPASDGTSDYFNNCDYTGGNVIPVAPQPFPSGNGVVGFFSTDTYGEFVGKCLVNPLLSGNTYNVEFELGFGVDFFFAAQNLYVNSDSPFEFSIYGLADCGSFPTNGNGCLEGQGWTALGSLTVSGAQGTWTNGNFDITVPFDVHAIAVGPSCAEVMIDPPGFNKKYHFLDDVIITGLLAEESIISEISESGDCVSGITLSIFEPAANSYQWYLDGIAIIGATNQNFDVAAPLANGIYNVVAYFNDGTCGASPPYNLFVDHWTLNVSGDYEDVSCNGFSDGQILVLPQSSNDPFDYNWNISESAEAIDSLDAGNYIVTVTDANGCIGIALFTINEPPPIVGSLINVTPPTNGNTDGIAVADISGGTPPHTYLWSNGEISDSVSNLGFGVHTVTVTDASGCMYELSVFFSSPLSVNYTSQYSNCFNDCSGSILLDVFGGLPNYTITWNDGSDSLFRDDLCPGTYQVSVSDSLQASINLTIEIEENPEIVVDPSYQETICDGSLTDINIETNGGSPGYSYLWDSGDTLSQLLNISAGIYNLTVTDSVLCSSTIAIEIMEGQPINYGYSTIDNECGETDMGEISLSNITGDLPIILQWSNNNSGSLNSNLSTGLYTVTLTDSNNCFEVDTIEILESSMMDVIATISPETCKDGNDGSISLIVDGGSGPLSVDWISLIDSTLEISNLQSGYYDVIILDSLNCEFTSTFEIPLTDTIITSALVVDESCANQGQGSIELTISGGSMPYNILWNNGDTSSTIVNLDPDNYEVMVIDSNGCEYQYNYVIDSGYAISIDSLVTSIDCPQDENGSIEITPLNGESPYNYEWSNNEATKDLYNIPAGNYYLTITDANGCMDEFEFTVFSSQPITYSIITTNPSCNDPYSGQIEIQSEELNTLDLMWGDGSAGPILENLEAGTYAVTLTDSNDCIYEELILIQENLPSIIGELQSGYFKFCDENIATLWYDNIGEYNNGNDVVQFILSIDSIDIFQSIITASNSPSFDFSALNLSYNTPYFITALIGDDNGNGTVDFSDLCLDFSNFSTIIFSKSPDLNFEEDQEFCFGDSTSLFIAYDNQGPYDISVLIGEDTLSFIDLETDINNKLYKEEDFSIHLISIANSNAPACKNDIPQHINYSVNFPDTLYNYLKTCISEDVDTIVTIGTNGEGCNQLVFEYIVLDDENCLEGILPSIYYPNIISGNSPINNYFTIYGNESLLNIESLTIFDRWGNKVFRKEDLIPNLSNEGWNGTYKGGKAMAGVYVFIAELELQNGVQKRESGTLTLIY